MLLILCARCCCSIHRSDRFRPDTTTTTTTTNAVIDEEDEDEDEDVATANAIVPRVLVEMLRVQMFLLVRR